MKGLLLVEGWIIGRNRTCAEACEAIAGIGELVAV
jgi:hypothetical protein